MHISIYLGSVSVDQSILEMIVIVAYDIQVAVSIPA